MQYSSERAQQLYFDFIQDLPNLTFDSKNPHFKNEYLSLPGLLEALTPVLRKHSAILTTGTSVRSETEDFNLLEVEFLFKDQDGSMHTVKSLTLVPALDNPQHMGSYLTYARRYAILAALGVAADKDDDAQTIATTATSLKRTGGGLKRHG